MRDYESIVVFNPDLEEEQLEQSLTKIKRVIENQGGNITDLQKWGLRNMAYQVQKHKQGNYVLMRFQGEPKAVSNLEQHCKLADPVIRFITVCLRPDQVSKTEEADLLPEGGE